MKIRRFEPGDELAQVRIYNTAAAILPRFKPATLDEVRRRLNAPDFDANTRLFAIEGDEIVGYATFQPNGRVSYPWCMPGQEGSQAPLFASVLEAMRAKNLHRAFAAYRQDWQPVQEFFMAQGFQKVRDMVNFVVDLGDMPTPAARKNAPISPLTPADIPAAQALASGVLPESSREKLEEHWFHNRYFEPSALFAVRAREHGQLEGVGLVIANPAYADPKQLDAQMPCFRLGAFGTEGMTAKRVNGLFSFLCRPQDTNRLGLEMVAHASYCLNEERLTAMAAQAPSDSPVLLRFYDSLFRRQGSFPVLVRVL